MSCTRCDNGPIQTFVRIDNANVKVIGCENHLKILIDRLKSHDTSPVTLQKLAGGGSPLDDLLFISGYKLEPLYRDRVLQGYCIKKVKEDK